MAIGPLTAGWSIPRVFSLIASASFSRLAASLYLFWSLKSETKEIRRHRFLPLEDDDKWMWVYVYRKVKAWLTCTPMLIYLAWWLRLGGCGLMTSPGPPKPAETFRHQFTIKLNNETRFLVFVMRCPHLFAKRYCNFVSSLGRVLDHQVVQRSKAGGNLVAALLGGDGSAAVMRLRH